MSTTKQTEGSLLDAAKSVYEALLPLDEQTRHRVITSALSLLGMTGIPPAATIEGTQVTVSSARAASGSGDRPLSPLELIQQKQPSTNPERLALFAYFRERHEGLSRFSKGDLRAYFAKAKLTPPMNYDRDFSNAVKLGYIYEDGSESYLTSKGVEAVESSFTSSIESRNRSRLAKNVSTKSPKKK